jgi:hypothetical protein
MLLLLRRITIAQNGKEGCICNTAGVQPCRAAVKCMAWQANKITVAKRCRITPLHQQQQQQHVAAAATTLRAWAT